MKKIVLSIFGLMVIFSAGNVSAKNFSGVKCSADLIMSQNLRAPKYGQKYIRNGKYDSYTKSTVKEAHILQKHLNRLGFSAGTVDGIIGPKTREAIMRLQKYLGTTQDGYIGPKTRALLNYSCETTVPIKNTEKNKKINLLEKEISDLIKKRDYLSKNMNNLYFNKSYSAKLQEALSKDKQYRKKIKEISDLINKLEENKRNHWKNYDIVKRIKDAKKKELYELGVTNEDNLQNTRTNMYHSGGLRNNSDNAKEYLQAQIDANNKKIKDKITEYDNKIEKAEATLVNSFIWKINLEIAEKEEIEKDVEKSLDIDYKYSKNDLDNIRKTINDKMALLKTYIESCENYNEVYVKYKGCVDISSFKNFNPSSSVINKIYYEDSENYLIVKLQDTYYNYCDYPEYELNYFINSNSLGKYYYDNIKGKYSCK